MSSYQVTGIAGSLTNNNPSHRARSCDQGLAVFRRSFITFSSCRLVHIIKRDLRNQIQQHIYFHTVTNFSYDELSLYSRAPPLSAALRRRKTLFDFCTDSVSRHDTEILSCSITAHRKQTLRLMIDWFKQAQNLEEDQKPSSVKETSSAFSVVMETRSRSKTWCSHLLVYCFPGVNRSLLSVSLC